MSTDNENNFQINKPKVCAFCIHGQRMSFIRCGLDYDIKVTYIIARYATCDKFREDTVQDKSEE